MKLLITLFAGATALFAVYFFFVPLLQNGSDAGAITNFKECADAGNPIMESYPRQCITADGPLFVEDIGNANEKADLIRLDAPQPGAVITSPLTVRGEARGTWFFEASFPLVLVDWDGKIIAEGYAQAQSDWMTEEFVPFEGTLTFTTPSYGERGALIAKKDNPSGLPEHDDALEIPIMFTKNTTAAPASSAEPAASTAVVETNHGPVTIEFFSELAPKTVENFLKLARAGFYDGTKFHRVIKGFMIQGGDPLSKDDTKKAYWGTGGPGYQFGDEIHSNNRNDIGTIAMANAGPNTNGSQFFINVANNNFLDTKHTVFGKVISGMEVVREIENLATGAQDRPVESAVIERVVVK